MMSGELQIQNTEINKLNNIECQKITEHTEVSTGIHIKLSATEIGDVAGIPITNTLITSWIVILLLVAVAFFISKKMSLVPSKIQLLFEEMISVVLKYMEEALNSRKLAIRYFPIIFTIFIFIFISNILAVIPGIGSIGFFNENGFISLLRPVNTDLNVTIALAIIAVFTIEAAGITNLGFWKYAGKFINFKSPVSFAVGIIELMSELIRLISFSFRLFGNIFAGKVFITVVAFLIPVIVPIPVMGFELFIGLVQAIIFALLTLMFIKIAIQEPH